LKELRKPPEGKRVMPFLLDYLAGPEPTATFKHPGFADEREVRTSWTVQPWWRFVLYRASRFGVTPYIEVGRPSNEARAQQNTRRNFVHPHDLDRLPIRTIRIGPTRKAA
uniref:hypothetical protein n=1 Tax=Mycobacterium avium TaxID=1764 RepID=UPI001E3AD848